jgi:hypothetical protein
MAKFSCQGKEGRGKNTTEKPYGIDIRHGAHVLQLFLWRGKRIGTNSFKKKLFQINLTMQFNAYLVPKGCYKTG